METTHQESAVQKSAYRESVIQELAHQESDVQESYADMESLSDEDRHKDLLQVSRATVNSR